jgi:hypothetical protein
VLVFGEEQIFGPDGYEVSRIKESKNHAKLEQQRSMGVETSKLVTIDSYSASSVEPPSARPAAPRSCSLEVAAEHLRTLEDIVLAVADAVHNLVAGSVGNHHDQARSTLSPHAPQI